MSNHTSGLRAKVAEGRFPGNWTPKGKGFSSHPRQGPGQTRESESRMSAPCPEPHVTLLGCQTQFFAELGKEKQLALDKWKKAVIVLSLTCKTSL